MIQRTTLSCLFVLGGISLLCCAPVLHGGDSKKGEEQSSTFGQLSKLLAKRVNLEKGIDPNTLLKDALEFLSDQHDVTILVDTEAFRNEGQTNIEDQPVRLPKMVNVRLSTVLRLLLEQVRGTYLVRSEYIEVTTFRRARPEGWSGNESEVGRPLLPLVNAELVGRPLDEALKELSNATDISVIIDKRVSDEGRKTAVTATLKNVALDTAVRMLADMADLGTVLVDNVLYVTGKENAEIVQAEDLKRRTRPVAGCHAPGLALPGSAAQ